MIDGIGERSALVPGIGSCGSKTIVKRFRQATRVERSFHRTVGAVPPRDSLEVAIPVRRRAATLPFFYMSGIGGRFQRGLDPAESPEDPLKTSRLPGPPARRRVLAGGDQFRHVDFRVFQSQLRQLATVFGERQYTERAYQNRSLKNGGSHMANKS